MATRITYTAQAATETDFGGISSAYYDHRRALLLREGDNAETVLYASPNDYDGLIAAHLASHSDRGFTLSGIPLLPDFQLADGIFKLVTKSSHVKVIP